MKEEMSESMYDKLGDLLSDTLDSGIIFSEPEHSPESEYSTDRKAATEKKSEESTKEKSRKEPENQPQEKSEKQKSNIPPNNKARKERKKVKIDSSFFRAENHHTGHTILKFSALPENVIQAFNFFKIPNDSTYEETKKTYREKLMYFHPDKWGDNTVLQKIAKEKTEQIIQFWKILDEWFKNKDKN